MISLCQLWRILLNVHALPSINYRVEIQERVLRLEGEATDARLKVQPYN